MNLGDLSTQFQDEEGWNTLQDIFAQRGTNSGLTGIDTYGLDKIKHAPLNEAWAVTDRKHPGKVLLDRETPFYSNDIYREILAHEAEHNRQHKYPRSYTEAPYGLRALALQDDEHQTTVAQPSSEELLSFIRGKEARHGMKEYRDKVTKGLSKQDARWLDANIMPGQDKFLEPTPEDSAKYYNTNQTSFIDKLRRAVRSFTAK